MDILRLDLEGKETKPPDGRELRFQAAALAAIACTAAGFLARFVFGAPLVPEILAQFVFAVAPIWVVELAVGMLGPFAKHLGFLASTAVYVLALLGLGIGVIKVRTRSDVSRAGLAALTLFVATGLLILPVLGGGILGSRLQQGALFTSVWLLAECGVYGLAVHWFGRIYLTPSTELTQPRLLNRRMLIRATGYAVVLIGVYDVANQLLGSWISAGSGRVRGGDGNFPNIDHLALEVTPASDFYKVSKNAFDPVVDGKNWALEIKGLVQTSRTITYEDLKSLPAVEQYATLCCISNEVGGDLIGNASWRGVRLKDLLDQAVVQPGAVDVVLHARDGYLDSIPIERAMSAGTLLAYEMNDQPLTNDHGYPLRLIVPGIYGMKNVKWITGIEVVDFDFKGYWQRRGWDDRAPYKTMSRIDAPSSRVTGTTTIAGIAFAGDRGISKVEISDDGGKTWTPANVKSPLGPFTWVLWHREWSFTQPGRHRLLVRATDGLGITQTAQYAPPAPDGSSGYHSVTITSD
jgi:DMSO/TMAO reductase YedYZ molybdopterin-dependent catalytic subunit